MLDKRKRLTQQRQVVYDIVLQSKDHPTAADIIERLHSRGHRISYATVYNSLRYLTENGFLHELKVGDAVTRYDARTEPHHHVVCQVCGRVDEVFTSLPQAFLETVAKDSHYRVEDVDLIIRGTCAQCLSEIDQPS